MNMSSLCVQEISPHSKWLSRVMDDLCPQFLMDKCASKQCDMAHEFLELEGLPLENYEALLKYLRCNEYMHARYCAIRRIAVHHYGNPEHYHAAITKMLFFEIDYDVRVNLLGNCNSIVELVIGLVCNENGVHSSWLDLASILPDTYVYSDAHKRHLLKQCTRLCANKPVLLGEQLELSNGGPSSDDNDTHLDDLENDVWTILHPSGGDWLKVMGYQLHKWCGQQFCSHITKAVFENISQLPNIAAQMFLNLILVAKTHDATFTVRSSVEIDSLLASIGVSLIVHFGRKSKMSEALQIMEALESSYIAMNTTNILEEHADYTIAHQTLICALIYLRTGNLGNGLNILRGYNFFAANPGTWQLEATHYDAEKRNSVCAQALSLCLNDGNVDLALRFYNDVHKARDPTLSTAVEEHTGHLLLGLINVHQYADASEVFEACTSELDVQLVRYLLVLLKLKGFPTRQFFKRAVAKGYYQSCKIATNDAGATILSTYVPEEIEVVLDDFFMTLKTVTASCTIFPNVHIFIKFEPYSFPASDAVPVVFSGSDNSCSLALRLIREVLTKKAHEVNMEYFTHTYFSPGHINMHVHAMKTYLHKLQ